MRWSTLALGVASMQCEETSYYLYYASMYEPDRGCVDESASIDVEIGPDPGSMCGAKCLTGTVDGGLIYATTMCGPVPVASDPSGNDPLCAPAIAALERSDVCLDGGGSTNPLDAASE